MLRNHAETPENTSYGVFCENCDVVVHYSAAFSCQTKAAGFCETPPTLSLVRNL